MHGHKIINQNGLHYLTLTTVGWVDVFTRVDYRDVLIESLNYCQKHKGLVINAYVIMSNHVHLICYAKEGYRLPDILRDFKTFTSKTITKDIIQNTTESRSECLSDSGVAASALQIFRYFQQEQYNVSVLAATQLSYRIR
jgi:REP element-mobilizing transposase RayT